jgi:uncharacterized phage protein gp47/JayE
MSDTFLSKLPPAPPAGCCDVPPTPSAVPVPVNNPPGLASIGYRIGTFSSFRRAMLDRIAAGNLLYLTTGSSPTSPPRPPANPFAAWREGTDGDYQTIFIELWAYLADILTFYQERIANEAYIGTATQRDSIMQLAQLIDYRPGPGAAASGLVAFTVARGKVLNIPTAFRVGSRAQPGQPAAIFETSAAITARAEHSSIVPSAVAPTNQFAKLSSFAAVFGAVGEVSAPVAGDLYGAAGLTYMKTLPSLVFEAVRAGALAIQAPATLANAALFKSDFRFPYRPFRDETTRTIVLQGVNTRLAVGDYVLVVENEHTSGEQATAYQVSSVAVDKTQSTTTITWQEPPGTTYDTNASPIALYALRIKAGAFGNTAPNWWMLPAVLTNSDAQHGGAPYPDNWDHPGEPVAYLPRGGLSHLLALDTVYDAVKGTPANPGWVVLVSSNRSVSQVCRFVDARPVTLTDYALNTKVTQLTLGPDAAVTDFTFGIRDCLILTGAESLGLQNNLPIPDPLQGDTLILAGLYPNLQGGQPVVVKGDVWTPSNGVSTSASAAELRLLDGPPRLDSTNQLTTVKFKQPLANRYVRATTTMLANVVAVTQGETVKDEVLGSGDGSALQSFALKKTPVTYLPSVEPAGVSPVQSTLLVTVNGVRWNERPTLAESARDAQDFTTRRDAAEQTTVVFGDGVNGARPPTGTDNVHARYRRGLGTSGNAPVDGVQQLIDNLAGVQQVTNPQPTGGGTDPEPSDQIRANAPTSMRTFNRAVSPQDYAALALSFPGIAKASAAWIARDASGKPLAQPQIQLTVAAVNENPIMQTPAAGQLRNFLDTRRDANVPLRIQDFNPVYVEVAVTVDLKDSYPRQATFARVQAALNPGVNGDGTAGYFALQNLDFGESLHLSAIYAVLMQVPGVRDANITTFRRMDSDGSDPSTVRDVIFIGPTEIAVIGNDPARPENGLLTIVQGSGGFVDT